MPLITEDAAQHGFAYRFGWGAEGLEALAPVCDVIVIVDVLRFTTAVSVTVAGGSTVFPYRWRDETASEYAHQRSAVLGGRREDGPVSLSPTDLMSLPTGSRIVLPSPNGSTLSFRAGELGAAFVLAGSLRNATATAHRASTLADTAPIGVIASGERWPGSEAGLRPSVEDMLGAGAVLVALDPSGAVGAPGCSPEAAAARSAFIDARPQLADRLASCASGRELTRIAFGDDVATAAELDVSDVAAQLVGDAFIAACRDDACLRSVDETQARWRDAGFVERQVDDELGSVGREHMLAHEYRHTVEVGGDTAALQQRCADRHRQQLGFRPLG